MHSTGPYKALSFQLRETKTGFVELSEEYSEQTQAGNHHCSLKALDDSNISDELHLCGQTYVYVSTKTNSHYC